MRHSPFRGHSVLCLQLHNRSFVGGGSEVCYGPHVFHTGVTQFYIVSIYELSVAVAIGEMLFNETDELFADVRGNIFTPWGVVP